MDRSARVRTKGRKLYLRRCALRKLVRIEYAAIPGQWEGNVSEDGPLWQGRRPRGVPLILVLSRTEAVLARPIRRGVIISIRAPGTEPPRLSPNWKAVLSLEIEDVDLNGKLDPEVDLRTPAEAIAAFVRAHSRAPQILLHCHAGASRSRSTAAAICESYGWPYRWTVLHRPLYHAVLAALRRHR